MNASTRRVALAGLFLILLTPLRAEALDYHIAIDSRLRRLEVSLCAATGTELNRLIAASELRRNLERLEAADVAGRPVTIRRTGEYVDFPDTPAQCVHYAIRTPRTAAGNHRASHKTVRSSSLDATLLRPSGLASWGTTRLIVQTASGVSVSAPGRRVESGDSVEFTFDDRPSDWDGDLVFGHLSCYVLDFGDARLNLAIVGAQTPQVATKLRDWVAAGARAIDTLYGRFPLPEVQIVVFALGRSDDPVPWGEVKRGAADAVHLYVDATRDLETLKANWVLTHEMSHLIHPFVAGGDAWLPEGIASYYQNVLRARAGVITEETAWKKLHAGFERGRKQTRARKTLARDTRKMMREAQYMRVYWSGAAIALMADVELRLRSRGAQSLARVLDEFAQCCLPSRRRWPAAELMRKFDAIADAQIFMPLYDKYVMDPVFPDVVEVYRELGLSISNGELVLSRLNAARALRASIMSPRVASFEDAGS